MGGVWPFGLQLDTTGGPKQTEGTQEGSGCVELKLWRLGIKIFAIWGGGWD